MPTTLRTRRIILGIALLLILTSLACRVGAAPLPPTVAPAIVATVVPPASAQPASQIVQVLSEDQVLEELYNQANPAVVNITIYAKQGDVTVSLGQGSGFVYDTVGHIITNAHVVHGAEDIEVVFWDGLISTATLVGDDLHSDLAVVRVSELPPGVSPLPLGNMDNLSVGQSVVAIGNPFGYSGTLTRGIISALGRTIPALTSFSIPQAIQTDAAINPGNSGGPLLNLDGEVVGVNAQIETGGTGRANTGIGFAIPVSIIRRVVPALIENGHYDWPWLGVAGGDITPSLVQAMNLTVNRGAYIVEVVNDGPAMQSGLRGASEVVNVEGRQVGVGGDIITAIDGQTVNTFDDVLIYLALQTSPGQQITLTILRDGESRDVSVTLGERPSQ